MDTERRILEAALSLFARRGFAGVSTRAIAEAANSNLALISYYFGSKEGLYSACVNHSIKTVFDSLETLPEALQRDRWRLLIETLAKRINEVRLILFDALTASTDSDRENNIDRLIEFAARCLDSANQPDFAQACVGAIFLELVSAKDTQLSDPHWAAAAAERLGAGLDHLFPERASEGGHDEVLQSRSMPRQAAADEEGAGTGHDVELAAPEWAGRRDDGFGAGWID